jgi:hypothetical protein
VHQGISGGHRQLETLCACDRRQVDQHGPKQVERIDGLERRLQRSGFELRQIEDGAQQLLDRRQGVIDLADQALMRLVVVDFGKRR